MYNPTNEQHLIDIMFKIALTVHQHRAFNNMNSLQVEQWIARELSKCGYILEKSNKRWILQEIR